MALSDQEKFELNERYVAALHQVQSATAADIGRFGEGSAGANPKHLRTGLNSAFVAIDALQEMLKAKGIITDDDVLKYNAEAMEREATRLTDYMREKMKSIRFSIP